MTAVDLLAAVHHRGASLAAVNGIIKVSAAAPLPDDLLNQLRQHKAELLTLLAASDAHTLPSGPCALCGCLSWWLDADTWRCRRCSPPTDEQLEQADTFVADPDGPPQHPPDFSDCHAIDIIPFAGGVRCLYCRHHQRTEHPHLARCAAGVASTNPTGCWWATDRHVCDKFERTSE